MLQWPMSCKSNGLMSHLLSFKLFFVYRVLMESEVPRDLVVPWACLVL